MPIFDAKAAAYSLKLDVGILKNKVAALEREIEGLRKTIEILSMRGN